MRKQCKALFTPDGCVLSMMVACLILAGLIYGISYISQRIFFAPLSESLGIHTSAEFSKHVADDECECYAGQLATLPYGEERGALMVFVKYILSTGVLKQGVD